MKTKLLMVCSFVLLTACSKTPEEEFVDICVAVSQVGEEAKQVCSCGYSKLVAKYGEAKMAQIIENPTNYSQVPDDYMDSSIEFALQCAEGR